MGKRILVQRRGRGGSVFICPSWKRVGDVKYRELDEKEKNGKLTGKVVALLHDPGRGAPVAKVVFEDGSSQLMVAPEGIFTGQEINIGSEASLAIGNVLPLAKIPDGSLICNIERIPNDGGKFARTSGSYAVVLAHDPNKVTIKLPSGKMVALSPSCRATIGIVAGGGRTEKPMLKAGATYHLSKVKAWKPVTVRGKAMNAVSHPHGGGQHPTGGTPTSRTAPPGQKVGHIASRKTGRR
jgi:large subunit ribosomal protein L2